jgi:hypothetical protein
VIDPRKYQRTGTCTSWEAMDRQDEETSDGQLAEDAERDLDAQTPDESSECQGDLIARFRSEY